MGATAHYGMPGRHAFGNPSSTQEVSRLESVGRGEIFGRTASGPTDTLEFIAGRG